MSRRTTGQEGLLLWLQARTHGYTNVSVVDFTYSWENGLAFCALVHTHYPDKIPFNDLKPENKEYNLKLAFDTAAEVGVPALMEPEDMLLECGPDRFSVVTYLSQFFHKFKDFDRNAPNAGKDEGARTKPKEAVDLDEEVRKRREALDKTLGRPERKCSKCGSGMSHGTIIEALGKHFHTTCFVCASCDKPFPQNKFMNVDGKPYCATCGKKAFSTNKNAGGSNAPPPVVDDNPKCGKCAELCGGDTIDAMGKSWHPSCFVCVTCSKQFVNGKFLPVDNKPYCEQCGRKAFISNRIKPAPAASPPAALESKPAGPFQTPGGLSKSKSMLAVPTQPKFSASEPAPSREHPKIVPPINSVSSRSAASQQDEKIVDSTASGPVPRASTPPPAAALAEKSHSTQSSEPTPSPATTPSPAPAAASAPAPASTPAPASAPIQAPSSSASTADKDKELEERRIKKAEEDAKKKREMEEREAKRKEMEELERKQKEEQRIKREEALKKKKLDDEERKRKEEEEKEAKRKEEEELKKKKSEEKRKQMEELKKKKEEEDVKKKQELEEEEAKKKEERAQRAEAAKKRREELKKLAEEEEAKKLAQNEAEKQLRRTNRVDIKSPDVTTNTAALSIEPRPLGANTAKPAVSTSASTSTSASASASAAASTPSFNFSVNNTAKTTGSEAKDSAKTKTCPAADVMCPWSGAENSIQSHVSTCHYVALKPVLSTLLKQNQEVLAALQELKQQFANLHK